MILGADSASCAVYERSGGEIEFVKKTGGDALASVEFVAPGEERPQIVTCPLAEVLALAAGGAQIHSVSRPDADALAWSGMARLDTQQQRTAFVVGRRPTASARQWMLGCDDWRGLAAMIYSKIAIPPAEGGTFGRFLLGLVAQTSVPGLRARLARARRVLGDDFSAAAAAGSFGALNAAAAQDGGDGGQPTLDWVIRSRALDSTDWHEVAGSVVGGFGLATNKRKGRVMAEIQKQAEEDAFGTGIDSPRGIREIVSLEQPIGDSDDGSTLMDQIAGALDVASGLEIADLLATTDLTRREREVFDLQFVDGSGRRRSPSGWVSRLAPWPACRAGRGRKSERSSPRRKECRAPAALTRYGRPANQHLHRRLPRSHGVRCASGRTQRRSGPRRHRRRTAPRRTQLRHW